MMGSNLLLGVLGTAGFARTVLGACSGPLVVDNFAQFNIHNNNLNSWASDDDTMQSFSATSGILNFTPKNDSSSYFYETLPCQPLYTDGYNAISFSFKGPAGGSISMELQSMTGCNATDVISSYIPVDGLTGEMQTLTATFESFVRSNLDTNVDAITAIVFADFTGTASPWQLANVTLACAPIDEPTSTVSAPPETTSNSVSTTTTVSATAIKRAPKKMKVQTPRAEACQNLLIDDFSSQSRLTFLNYNSMFQASSDDATMNSVMVGSPSRNHVTLTPTNTDSYWFTEFGCVNAVDLYGGISLRIKAAKGTTFTIELQSSFTCDSEENVKSVEKSNADLGWTFDGTEKLYSMPFSKFAGIDTTQLMAVNFIGLSKAISFGPMAFYCGSTPSEYPIPVTTTSSTPTATVPVTTGTASALVIDTFKSKDSNDLNFWRGADDGMTLTYGKNKLTITSPNPDYSLYTQLTSSCTDYSLYTQLTSSCTDIRRYDQGYLHIAYTGSSAFTVSLQQHNAACNDSASPYPETWDSLSAARYASATDIYMPLSHFAINRTRAIGLSLHGFYTPSSSTTLTRIEILPSVPAGHQVPAKVPNGSLVFACTRPNSFAFAIDDGEPALAQQVLSTIRAAGIHVTFFTVGLPLLDPGTNLTNVYREMRDAGHQIALHSYTHPKMEGLPAAPDIDWEYDNDLKALKSQLNLTSRYFRPPFGTEGARMREELAGRIRDPYVVNWSVDVEDWLWAESSTPEKQLNAFRRDVGNGGNLVVMHYLYNSTVGYLEEFIQIAKATGKQLMRVDQCLEDPEAPPL